MCRLAAVHAPLGGFWKNPENANQTKIQIFNSSNMTHNTFSHESEIKHVVRTPLTWFPRLNLHYKKKGKWWPILMTKIISHY